MKLTRSISRKWYPLAILLLTCFTLESFGQDAREKFFETRIRPVLIKECYGCHSAKSGNARGGLLVDTREGLLDGGDSGAAVVAGSLDDSLLWNAINHEDFRMPPGNKLSRETLADFRSWIETGAYDPRERTVTHINTTITTEDIERARENFWAYRQPQPVTPPAVKQQNWANSIIDQFVLAGLEENGLTPAGDADPHTVLRRLCFDIVGLPPTPEQIEVFQQMWKHSPEKAIAHVADRLLESPQYGERWGRHWLDVARYAESTGKERNATFPTAWRYRDYVIDSFNADKPYDRFIQEQLAGDLLPVSTDKQWAENLTATGFLAIGPKTLTEQNGRQFKLDLVDEQIDVATRVILGVSVACARCHDHKFDPIPQTDYYAMAGIFQNMTTHYGTLDNQQNRRPSNLLMLPLDDPSPFEKPLSLDELAKLKQQLQAQRARLAELARQRRQARQNGGQVNIRDFAVTTSIVAALEDRINSHDQNGKPFTQAMGVQEIANPVDARLLVRGEFDKPAQLVPRGMVQVLSRQNVDIPERSSGRRELAAWMTSPDNPLTARVMVNRIWQHLLGHGIVRTPENFGATGMAPTHPELLDYLAIQFVENGWSVKQAIREIVSSRIYRTSSQFDQAAFNRDSENRFLWRFEPRRLEAEVIRDSILSISDDLNLVRPRASLVARVGHTVVRDGNLFSLGENLDRANSMRAGTNSGNRRSGFGGNISRPTVYNVNDPSNHRSVYLPIVRDNTPRTLDVFDLAESSMVIGKREESNTPDQALFMLNNSFVTKQSQAIARRLMEHSPDVGLQIKMAFRLAYGREASPGELRATAEFYRAYGSGTRFARLDHERKMTAVCQAIIAAAEFRYLN